MRPSLRDLFHHGDFFLPAASFSPLRSTSGLLPQDQRRGPRYFLVFLRQHLFLARERRWSRKSWWSLLFDRRSFRRETNSFSFEPFALHLTSDIKSNVEGPSNNEWIDASGFVDTRRSSEDQYVCLTFQLMYSLFQRKIRFTKEDAVVDSALCLIFCILQSSRARSHIFATMYRHY